MNVIDAHRVLADVLAELIYIAVERRPPKQLPGIDTREKYQREDNGEISVVDATHDHERYAQPYCRYWTNVCHHVLARYVDAARQTLHSANVGNEECLTFAVKYAVKLQRSEREGWMDLIVDDDAVAEWTRIRRDIQLSFKKLQWTEPVATPTVDQGVTTDDKRTPNAKTQDIMNKINEVLAKRSDIAKKIRDGKNYAEELAALVTSPTSKHRKNVTAKQIRNIVNRYANLINTLKSEMSGKNDAGN